MKREESSWASRWQTTRMYNELHVESAQLDSRLDHLRILICYLELQGKAYEWRNGMS